MTLRPFALLVLAAPCIPAHADALSDAFSTGAALGRSGNTSARSQIQSGTARSTVPQYTETPPAAAHFGSTSLGPPAAAAVDACANATPENPACAAMTFTQTNATRRPTFTLAPNDPLRTRARTIHADPQAIAGQLAGTYSNCTVQTVQPPDVFETALCHQSRTPETLTCDKALVVRITERNSCEPGTWFGNFWVNTWGNGEVGVRYAGVVLNAYCQPGGTVRMSFSAACTESPCGGSAAIDVDATNGNPAPQTFTNFIGRSWFATDQFNRVDYRGGSCTQDQCSFEFCTRYEAEETSCWEGECTSWTVNETRACGTFTFERPRTLVTVTDAWDNQCAALEARTQ